MLCRLCSSNRYSYSCQYHGHYNTIACVFTVFSAHVTMLDCSNVAKGHSVCTSFSFLVCDTIRRYQNCMKDRYSLSKAKMRPLIHNNLEMVQDRM